MHIDRGVLGLSRGGLLSTVQDLFVTPPWMALVWAVHALVVMLEWCFAIDLLDSTSTALGAGLRQMQATLTDPWLPCALAIASLLALYHGLLRRRVGDALGQTLTTGAMMVGGLWVIANPSGSVGAVGALANEASLSTLAASARGSPSSPGRTLADGMAEVFAAVIEAPWCYLEFGDVAWCRSSARLDPRLKAAGLAVARAELAQVGCRGETASGAPCVAAASQGARTLENSAELLRGARSNGAVFLALPANGPERNSINNESSLLRVMCENDHATSCRGPMAAQAEFRTDGGTWKRVGGLVLIIVGAAGMLLLLGFIALRLLSAAIFSLLYLLLAPAAILAPALGDSGRAVFRKWVAQLLGAVVCKLLFAFLLGVVLAVLAILASLEGLGWWTQWLLMSAFWWGAFARRHQTLSFVGRDSTAERAGARSPLRRVRRALPGPRKLAGAARALGERFGAPPPSVGERRKIARAARERAVEASDEQVRRGLARELSDARARADARTASQVQLGAKRSRLERVRRAGVRAEAVGDWRKRAQLDWRAARIEEEIERAQNVARADRATLAAAGRAGREAGRDYTSEQAERWETFLDEQARLPASMDARGVGATRRDYSALAPIAGHGREEYERLDAPSQRRVRMEVDRELSLRGQFWSAASEIATSADPAPGLRERHRLDRAFDSTLERSMRDAGRAMPSSRSGDWVTEWRHVQRARASTSSGRDSSVMRDAREVASRRKRQLGRDRP